MCEYCDEKGLPCLMCGRACMTFHFERDRCKGCGSVNRPPREWPIFTYCPYCGRNLNEDKNQEENEDMSKYVWTAEADETIRRMINEGAPRVDICDVLGCTDKQLNNRLCVLRRKDEDFPRLERGRRSAVACADDGAEAVASPVVDLSLAGREAEAEPEIPEDKPEESVPAPVESTATGQENLLEHLVKMVEDREIELKEATRELERLREQVEVYVGMIDIKQAKIDEQERVILGMAMEIYGG